MSDLREMWVRSSSGAKLGLAVGVLLIALITTVFARWALAKEYQALFTQLSEQDAATMIEELDRMKVPYRLDDGGRSILVPEELVHKTRLQLVGKNLPLHGAVGFEIFNNTDFGMTEFTQKVNYQRALQGELTRTIMALEEVQSARVHLALPESSAVQARTEPPEGVGCAGSPSGTVARAGSGRGDTAPGGCGRPRHRCRRRDGAGPEGGHAAAAAVRGRATVPAGSSRPGARSRTTSAARCPRCWTAPSDPGKAS